LKHSAMREQRQEKFEPDRRLFRLPSKERHHSWRLLMFELGDQQPRLETSATARRSILRAAGLLGLTGVGAAALGACSEASSSSPPAAPAAAETSAPDSPSPTAAATSSKPSASPAKAPEGPSVAASKVPVGGGVILENADYVITQPSKGKYKAFSKICTHQGCPVASVANGVIHCNCHGSEYSIKDGSVTNPPAPKALAEAKTTVLEGKVYVTG
jgi:Rieske Fe-S protein